MENRSEKYSDYRNEIYKSANLNSLRIKVSSSLNSNEKEASPLKTPKEKKQTALEKYNKKNLKMNILYGVLVCLILTIFILGIIFLTNALN